VSGVREADGGEWGGGVLPALAVEERGGWLGGDDAVSVSRERDGAGAVMRDAYCVLSIGVALLGIAYLSDFVRLAASILGGMALGAGGIMLAVSIALDLR
jgi:hypothetical protein